MARFQPALDVWQLSEGQRARLMPGQWIYAGTRDHIGRYLGQKSGGVDVVAWHKRASGFPGGYRDYVKRLRQYASAT
jgi:hypothetical protein